jgi:hypothetical protein
MRYLSTGQTSKRSRFKGENIVPLSVNLHSSHGASNMTRKVDNLADQTEAADDPASTRYL